MADTETAFLKTLETKGLSLQGAPTRDFPNVVPLNEALKAKDEEVRAAITVNGRAALPLTDKLNRFYVMALGPYVVGTLIIDKLELGSSDIFQQINATVLAGDVELPSKNNPEGTLRFGGIMDVIGKSEATVPPGYNPRLRFLAGQKITTAELRHLSVINQMSLVGEHELSVGGIVIPTISGADPRHMKEAMMMVNDGSLGQQQLSARHGGDEMEKDRNMLTVSSKGPNALLRVNYWTSKKYGLSDSIPYIWVTTEDTLGVKANQENALQLSQIVGFDSVIKHEDRIRGSAQYRFEKLVEPTI